MNLLSANTRDRRGPAAAVAHSPAAAATLPVTDPREAGASSRSASSFVRSEMRRKVFPCERHQVCASRITLAFSLTAEARTKTFEAECPYVPSPRSRGATSGTGLPLRIGQGSPEGSALLPASAATDKKCCQCEYANHCADRY